MKELKTNIIIDEIESNIRSQSKKLTLDGLKQLQERLEELVVSIEDRVAKYESSHK